MALLHANSFDTLEALSPTYAGGTYVDLSAAKVRGGSGQSIRIAYAGTLTLGATHFTASDELYFGWALYTDTANVSYQQGAFFNVLGDGSGVNFALRMTISHMKIYDATATLIDICEPPTIFTWNFIEVKIKVSDSSSVGDAKLRINEKEVWSCGAGEDFKHSSNSTNNIVTAQIGTQTGGGTIYGYIDDLYICDATGSINNTFLGDCKCEVLYPNANGNSSQFMGSDGNQVDNYLLVDDETHTGDTDYVYDDTVDQIDLYAFDNLTATIASIKGVIVTPVMRKDDAGSRTARAMIRQNSSNYEGAELFPSTDYQHFPTIWETDPDTSSAWTETGVNSAEFGLTIES